MRQVWAVEAESTVTRQALHVFYLAQCLNHRFTIGTYAPFRRDAAVIYVILEAKLGILLKLILR